MTFEKTGSAVWTQCPDCGHWFHVSPALLRMETVDLICPGCGAAFPPGEATAVAGDRRSGTAAGR